MSMNKIRVFCVLLFAFLVSGCATAENKGAAQSCAEFLNNIPSGAQEVPVKFDIERSLDISAADQMTSAYDSIRPLASGCSVGEIAPTDPEEIMAPWETHGYVDVAAGVSGATPWIQFIYPSIDDLGPGLASSVVFYDSTGSPIATKLVSEYHSWDNTSVLRSVMFEGRIESCRQQLEHFFYDQHGDIAGELESSIRSECEHSSSTYPYP